MKERNDQMMRCRIRLKEDLSETKSISAKNKKIQIRFRHLTRPLHRSRRDRFPSHDIFFASGRTNRAKSENSKHVFFWASSEAKRTTVREISLWREPTHSFLDFLDILPDLADDPSWAFPIARIRDTHRLPALLIHQLYLP